MVDVNITVTIILAVMSVGVTSDMYLAQISIAVKVIIHD